MLDVYKATLALSALYNRASDEAGKYGVFREVFNVTSVVRRTVNVHAGTYHYGKVVKKGRFAKNELTILVSEFFVPGIRKVNLYKRYQQSLYVGARPRI